MQELFAEWCSPKTTSNVLVSTAKELTAYDANHKEGFIVRKSLQGRAMVTAYSADWRKAQCTGQEQTYRQNLVVLKLPLL